MEIEMRLIDAFRLTIRLSKKNAKRPLHYDDVLAIIADENTVDAVEVVHGRWEDGFCTACGFDIRDLIDGESDFRNWVWEGLPYCPNCGAKMDGGNENA